MGTPHDNEIVRLCARCKEPKTVGEFNRNARYTDGLHSYCRQCQARHYQDNRVRHLRNVRRSTDRRRAQMRQIIASRFTTGCVDCGIRDYRVLEFDHVRGTKLCNINLVVRNGYAITTLVREINKCDVRCKNCHAIMTADRRSTNWFDAYTVTAEPLREDSNPRPCG